MIAVVGFVVAIAAAAFAGFVAGVTAAREKARRGRRMESVEHARIRNKPRKLQ